MKSLLANPATKHTLLAIGAAVAAAAAVIPATGTIDWRNVALTGLSTLLAALGIGYAARQQPPK